MRHTSRSRFTLLAALAALVVATLPFVSGTASATTYGYSGTLLGPSKILRLHTGSTDSFIVHGTTSPVDAIGVGTGNSKCKLRFDGAAPADPAKVNGDLVTLQARGRDLSTGDLNAAPSGWYVGFSNTDNSIGVGSEPSNNTKCSQVNEVSPTSEALVVELRNGGGSPYAGWYWDTIELDIEAKFRPQHVYYTLLKDGAPVSGQTRVELPICGDPAADCGPDSADLDNWRSVIPQPVLGVYPSLLFDEVRIWPETTGGVGNGAISLKGGSDNTPPFCLTEEATGCVEYGLADEVPPDAPASVTDSLFRLVHAAEGEICEGGTVNEPTQSGGTAEVFFRPDADPAINCKFYALTYSRSEANLRNLEFLTAGSSTLATFEVTIAAWDPEPAVLPVPVTQVEPPLPFHPGQWCVGSGPSPNWTMPSGESWCLFEQSTVNAGPDGDGSAGNPDWVPGYTGQLMQVTEHWLLIGDANGRR